jgi:serine protease Do
MNQRTIHYLIAAVGALGCAAAVVANSLHALESLEEAAIQSAVDRVRPAVVRIDLIGSAASQGQLEANGPTSGLIVTPEGHVLTSTFGFEQPPASILVTLDDGRQMPATLQATDHSRQLVLLKLQEATQLALPETAPLSEVAAGEYAVAVGRALEMNSPNVALGIVSAVGRLQGRAVQTDASISPVNYGGPLVDIHGRVIGVLTPLTPENSEGATGTDWYDSGIGFAVPLDGYQSSLKRLQSGENLYRGRVGIAFKSGNPLETAAEIASVRARGPAAAAGLETGDQVMKINGTSIETQAEFRRALGRYYSGDSIDLTIKRQDANVEVRVTLVSELEPFRHAAIGLRPRHDTATEVAGVAVAQILPGGPAEAATIKAGDIVKQVDDQVVANWVELTAAIGKKAPGDTVRVRLLREAESLEVTATLAERMAGIYPPEDEARPTDDSEVAHGESREFKLPEFAAPCPLYVPSDGASSTPLGLLVVLQSGEDNAAAEAPVSWKRAAERHRLVLAMPGPQERRGWSQSDLEYIQQLTRTLSKRYRIDPRRVGLFGADVPNSVTLAMWLTNREQLRGLALGSAELPERFRPPENEADRPCLILLTTGDADRRTAQFLERFGEIGYAVATTEDDSPDQVAAWVDSLDRL